MVCRDAFPSRRLVSSNITLPLGGSCDQAWPVTINTFRAVFQAQLSIQPSDFNILRSEHALNYIVLESESLMLQKIDSKNLRPAVNRQPGYRRVDS